MAGEHARAADNKGVQPLMLLAVLLTSLGLSLTISRIFLECVLYVMTHGSLPFVFHWRRVVFATTLFWLWYLTPTVAASHAATRVFRLLIP